MNSRGIFSEGHEESTWAMDVGGERKSGVDLRERVSGNQWMHPGFAMEYVRTVVKAKFVGGLDAKQGARRYHVQQELVLFLRLASFEDREVLFFTWPVTFVQRLLKQGPQGPLNRPLPGKYAR